MGNVPPMGTVVVITDKKYNNVVADGWYGGKLTPSAAAIPRGRRAAGSLDGNPALECGRFFSFVGLILAVAIEEYAERRCAD